MEIWLKEITLSPSNSLCILNVHLRLFPRDMIILITQLLLSDMNLKQESKHLKMMLLTLNFWLSKNHQLNLRKMQQQLLPRVLEHAVLANAACAQVAIAVLAVPKVLQTCKSNLKKMFSSLMKKPQQLLQSTTARVKLKSKKLNLKLFKLWN